MLPRSESQGCKPNKVIRRENEAIGEPALVAQWRKSLAGVCLACVAAKLRRSGLGSTLGSGGLSVYASQLSAYSEINILGRHTVSTCILLNL